LALCAKEPPTDWNHTLGLNPITGNELAWLFQRSFDYVCLRTYNIDFGIR
jgi:hypothetical protein